MSSDQPVRVLQLGLGARGRKWAHIVRASQQVIPVAYVDPRPEARAWAAEHGAPNVPVFDDPTRAMREAAVDLALIATPPADRRALVVGLLHHGVHVLAEKPLALTFDDALEIVRAAERTGRRLGVVQNFRYMPATQRLRERVDSGKYGAPTYVTVTYIRNRDGYAPHLNKYPLTMDHPMLLEQSIHHLDLLRYVYDREPETVTCMTWNPPGSQYRGDACAAALIRFTGGLIAIYHGTWVSGSESLAFQWRTDFERGVVIQRDLFGDLTEGAIGDPSLQTVPLPAFEPFTDDSAALLEDFIAAWRADRPFACSGHDHLRTLALTLACVESSRTGERVALERFAVGLDAHP